MVGMFVCVFVYCSQSHAAVVSALVSHTCWISASLMKALCAVC